MGPPDGLPTGEKGKNGQVLGISFACAGRCHALTAVLLFYSLRAGGYQECGRRGRMIMHIKYAISVSLNGRYHNITRAVTMSARNAKKNRDASGGRRHRCRPRASASVPSRAIHLRQRVLNKWGPRTACRMGEQKRKRPR